MLDFAKAFAKVPHKRLTQKHQFYGITKSQLVFLTIFNPFLLDDTVSNHVLVSSGVALGTVLGHLLFLLYVNDLPLLTTNSTAKLLADDSLICQPIKTPNDYKLLQTNPDSLEQWETTRQINIRHDERKTIYRLQTP